MKRAPMGLTLVEIAIALALVVFLATVAWPGYRQYATRQIVAEAIDLAGPAKATVEEFAEAFGKLPTTRDVSLPFVNAAHVSLTAWAAAPSSANTGTITITTRSNESGGPGALDAKAVVLTAVFDPTTRRVAWACGGTSATTLETAYLPAECLAPRVGGNG